MQAACDCATMKREREDNLDECLPACGSAIADDEPVTKRMRDDVAKPAVDDDDRRRRFTQI